MNTRSFFHGADTTDTDKGTVRQHDTNVLANSQVAICLAAVAAYAAAICGALNYGQRLVIVNG